MRTLKEAISKMFFWGSLLLDSKDEVLIWISWLNPKGGVYNIQNGVIQADNRIKISDFAKLTGSTLKTIMYYHKIGLLHEPERSPGGYRLYGPEELTRMRYIQYLKSLGVDLKHIKEIFSLLFFMRISTGKNHCP